MNNKKLIIFDFDGTIADSWLVVMKTFNELAGGWGFEGLSLEKAEELKNFSSDEIIFKKYKVSKIKLPFFLAKARKELNKKIVQIEPFPGVKKVLLKLKKNHSLVLLTSNSEENVEKFLKNNDLNVFDSIIAGNSLFGKSRTIRKVMGKYKLAAEDVVLVGDETRDIEAAKKSGIKIISVNWGFNSEKILKKYNPDFLAGKPEDILEAINKIYAL